MTKSHVSVEQHQCKFCLKTFDTNGLLFDTTLGNTLEPKTITGLGVCTECREKLDQGYVALIETSASDDEISITDPNRTGRVVFLRKEAYQQIFNTPVPKEAAFIEPKVFEYLENLAADIKGNSHGLRASETD